MNHFCMFLLWVFLVSVDVIVGVAAHCSWGQIGVEEWVRDIGLIQLFGACLLVWQRFIVLNLIHSPLPSVPNQAQGILHPVLHEWRFPIPVSYQRQYSSHLPLSAEIISSGGWGKLSLLGWGEIMCPVSYLGSQGVEKEWICNKVCLRKGFDHVSLICFCECFWCMMARGLRSLFAAQFRVNDQVIFTGCSLYPT